MSSKFFRIGAEVVAPGESKTVRLNLAKLFDFTELELPVQVVRGKVDGPKLFISGAIHGDEIVGTEIIRRLLEHSDLNRIRGTLIAVPIVNVYGFNNKSRYLPDRRDLNRSFPGSLKGPLASQLANLFMKEVVRKSTHGIDLHSGARDRSNLPQIRACLDDKETRRLASTFGAPIVLHSNARDGSLREAARKRGIPMLLFEGGEALRIDERVVKMGLNGCLSVMRLIGMLPGRKKQRSGANIALGSQWVRAPHSGTLTQMKKLGAYVAKDQVIANITNPLGSVKIKLRAPVEGTIIGRTEIPLVNKGDAVFHIATPDREKNLRWKENLLFEGDYA